MAAPVTASPPANTSGLEVRPPGPLVIRHPFLVVLSPAVVRVSVFSGKSAPAGASSYLVAAAALEARVFPICVYDPSAGPDWPARFSIAGNPAPGAEWPLHDLLYERAGHKTERTEVAFTFVDFAACDPRCASHFAHIGRDAWHDRLISVPDALAAAGSRALDAVPAIFVVNEAHQLRRLLVDDVMVRQAARCLAMWKGWQELGERAKSQKPEAKSEGTEGERAQASEPARAERGAGGSAPFGDAQGAPSEVERAGAKPPGSNNDDPFIETPRCSTCNECTQINSRMFAYNDNRQAFIRDAAAGTYRQLVEAAESCQVSIIHPGKPKDPNEPGLAELIERAQAFR